MVDPNAEILPRFGLRMGRHCIPAGVASLIGVYRWVVKFDGLVRPLVPNLLRLFGSVEEVTIHIATGPDVAGAFNAASGGSFVELAVTVIVLVVAEFDLRGGFGFAGP